MKKGLLTSFICFTSMVLFSCGSKTVKVTILECIHCSFENKTSADVRKDFVIQAYLDKGYKLDTDEKLIDIRLENGASLIGDQFYFDESNNKLTIYKDNLRFGNISIKADAAIRENTIYYHCNGANTYNEVKDGDIDQEITIENDFKKTITIKSGATPLTTESIKISPSDIVYTYDADTSTLKIGKNYCYTDMNIILP